jgi:hypothetical protein
MPFLARPTFLFNIGAGYRDVMISVSAGRWLVYISNNGKDYVRFEDITAVTMKNAVFWDIKTQFVPHRRHITSPLQSPAS